MSTQSDHRRLSSQLRLSLPLNPSLTPSPKSPFPFSPSSSTPSKLRRVPSSSSSFSSLLLLLISLHSFYPLLPFLRDAPSSFSLFPFSFLISLLSLLLYLPFSHPQTLTLTLTLTLSPPLLAKSLLLTLVFLFRFHSLRYCSASASILADFAGTLAARSLSGNCRRGRRWRRVVGFVALAVALFLLSYSWDCAGCFPFFATPADGCARAGAIGFTFFSGFLGFHERAAGNSGALRQLGKKRTRLASLVGSTVILFFPACVSLVVSGGGGNWGGDVSLGAMVWPLISTVVFGVVLNENLNGEEKFGFGGKSFQQEFLATFFCTLVLEIVYYSRLSLPGFFICGFFLWVSVRELGSSSFQYVELGNLDSSGNMYELIVNPLRHVLSQRKTRKIALFLLINAAYMVVEFVAGFVSNSLGLISDACHMLFDCAALSIGLYASYISGLPANNQFNYGRGRFEVLSGYANAVFLVLVGALIVLESMERILDPQEISTSSLLAVSVGGLVVNIIGLVFFHEEHHHAHGGGGSCSHSHSHSNCNAESHSISHCDSHGDTHGGHDHYCSGKNGHHHTSSNSNVHLQSVSHEHSHVVNDEHSHSHSHHHHDHHHNQSDNCDHDHDSSRNSHHYSSSNSNAHFQSTSHEQSHVGNDEHSHSHSHHHHDPHHNQSDNCDHHMHGDKHNHNLISQDHDRHCDHQEHHHQCQMHHAGDCNHQDSSKHNHEHQNLLIGIKEEGLKMHYHIDHNMEGIFLHVLADTLGSVGVVISTLLIKYKGWLIADPACSIFISVMIISSVVPLLRNSAEILLQRIPRTHEQNLLVTRDSIMRIEGVCGVQNLHVWSFSNSEIVGTVHLHLSSEADKVLIKKRVSDLFHKAGIKDITIQVECVR